mmetsp:Transcript_158452/g.279682  ORF Transcript_158452/g.279682 Transcript_158452/m.279682 type:complete len:143 (-) Transcript_158452:2-430(-)
MASGITAAAHAVLERRVPYFAVQLGLKAIVLITVFTGQSGFIRHSLVLACAVATALDVALRIAASRNHWPSLGKHGIDCALALLLFGDLALDCGSDPDARLCTGLRLVIPFAILVSMGGNLMRLTRTQRQAVVTSECDLERG